MAVRAIVVALLAASPCLSGELPSIDLRAHGSLRLAVIGDVGLGAEAVMRGVRVVAGEKPIDAILLVGDNVYPHGVKSVDDPAWHRLDALATLNVPILAILGNHDYVGNAQAQVDATGRFPHWQMPARNYAVHSALADFAMIDTTAYLHHRDSECPFCAAFDGSRTKWRIVVGHHTVVSSGFHGFFPRSEAKRMRALLPQMKAQGVDLYICGHDHHLELIGGKPAMLVSGAASDPVPPVALHLETIYPPEATIYERIGFAIVEITPAALRVRFYDDRGRARSDWLSASVVPSPTASRAPGERASRPPVAGHPARPPTP